MKVKCFSILLTPFSFKEWANQNNNDSSIMLWQNETTEINQQSLLMYMLSTSKKQNKISEVFSKRFLKHSSQSSTKLKDGKAQFQTLYNALYNWFNFENKMQCTSSHNYFYAFLYRIVYGGVNEHIFIDELYVFLYNQQISLCHPLFLGKGAFRRLNKFLSQVTATVVTTGCAMR